MPTKKKDVIVFEDKEVELLKKNTEGLDLENESDLLEIPEDIPELTPKDLDKIIESKDVKTLLREPNDNPSIADTFSETDIIPELTESEIEALKKEIVDRHNNLVMQLATNDSIKLHINAGMKNGKMVWIEKNFYFNSIDKGQELKLNLLNARLRSIASKHTILGTKPIGELTEQEQEFLSNSQMMIEIAAYRLSEYEARLKFGMTADEFAKVDANEYNIATSVYLERTKANPSYRRRR